MRGMLQEWNDARTKQDAVLDEISNGLNVLKDMGMAMQEELDRQDPLVDAIEDKVNCLPASPPQQTHTYMQGPFASAAVFLSMSWAGTACTARPRWAALAGRGEVPRRVHEVKATNNLSRLPLTGRQCQRKHI